MELAEARDWYESCLPGLGAEFLDEVDHRLASIRDLPEACPQVHQEIRRALLSRFPYGIFYVIQENGIFILACFHASRDPRQWKRRI